MLKFHPANVFSLLGIAGDWVEDDHVLELWELRLGLTSGPRDCFYQAQDS